MWQPVMTRFETCPIVAPSWRPVSNSQLVIRRPEPPCIAKSAAAPPERWTSTRVRLIAPLATRLPSWNPPAAALRMVAPLIVTLLALTVIHCLRTPSPSIVAPYISRVTGLVTETVS